MSVMGSSTSFPLPNLSSRCHKEVSVRVCEVLTTKLQFLVLRIE